MEVDCPKGHLPPKGWCRNEGWICRNNVFADYPHSRSPSPWAASNPLRRHCHTADGPMSPCGSRPVALRKKFKIILRTEIECLRTDREWIEVEDHSFRTRNDRRAWASRTGRRWCKYRPAPKFHRWWAVQPKCPRTSPRLRRSWSTQNSLIIRKLLAFSY